MDTFISVEEARDAILDRITPLGAERLLITEAAGRRLREEITAPFDAPAFDNSAMDGFAMRAADAHQAMRLVGESAAGAPFGGVVGEGEAIRIMTGAAVPEGADCVVMRENASIDGSLLRVDPAPRVGANIRRRGEYMRAGEVVIAAGEPLSPADIGLLAAFGRTVVYATRAPRVTIITTGTELVEPDRLGGIDEASGAGQIINSNAYMLECLARSAGAVVTVAPIAPDDQAATRAVLLDAARSADLLLTVGGVSVGDYDFVRDALEDLSGGMQFWKVRMKPGKPLAFGVIDGRVPAIGLPGNPVSSFVCYQQFVRPALAAMAGAPRAESVPQRVKLRTTHDIRSPLGRRQYVLGAAQGELFRPSPDQSSGNPLAMRGCTAFGVVEEGIDFVGAGETLEVEIFA